jgi:hypothetical protein
VELIPLVSAGDCNGRQDIITISITIIVIPPAAAAAIIVIVIAIVTATSVPSTSRIVIVAERNAPSRSRYQELRM